MGNLAASVITSSVVCYRAALHRRRSSCASSSSSSNSSSSSVNAAAGQSKGDCWCVLSFNYRTMRASSDVVAVSSRSPSTDASPSNSLKSGPLDNISLLGSSKTSSESSRRQSPVQSLESLQQCDDNDNVVPNSSSGGAHFKCRKALGKEKIASAHAHVAPNLKIVFFFFHVFHRDEAGRSGSDPHQIPVEDSSKFFFFVEICFNFLASGKRSIMQRLLKWKKAIESYCLGRFPFVVVEWSDLISRRVPDLLLLEADDCPVVLITCSLGDLRP